MTERSEDLQLFVYTAFEAFHEFAQVPEPRRSTL
jgi:hypothetical protein